MMRILFCGGGTAGHVSPAIAIAEGLREKVENCEILFVGRLGGEENAAVKKAAFNLKTIEIYGIERKLSLKNIKRLFIARRAIGKAKKIIEEFKPDVVVGTGGYVCFPVLHAARKLKIPTAIHESNACPGLVTRLLSPKCDRVFLNLAGSEGEYKKKENIRIVGNPVRAGFFKVERSYARRKLGIKEKEFFILSFGGSGGSEKMNTALLSLIKNHSQKNKNIRHVHATGKKYYKRYAEIKREINGNKRGCEVLPYIENMPLYMTAADLVISRCGAMTLTELSAAGCASILIPSPNVTNNHQYKNAKLFSDAGAAILLPEEELTEKTLLNLVESLEDSPKKRLEMAEKIRQFYHENSSDKIIDEITKLVK